MDDKQNNVYQRAKGGHNLMIVGPPGTGKTYLLGHIIEHFLLLERKVAITSTTGISSCILRKQLKERVADLPPVTTIHRFAGITDGRHTDDKLLNLLQTSEAHKVYRDNILQAHVLIIDEESMMSRRTFEQLEFLFRHIHFDKRPFGGMQVVLAGDFLQLPPIPTPEYGDDGSSIICSCLVNHVHVEVLERMHRQSEIDLISAIHEVARGQLTDESLQLIQRMKRSLPPGPEPVKLMSRRHDVNIWNARALVDMEGDEKVYKCIDEGNCAGIQVEKELHLKIGCPVFLLVNLSDTLVNGLRGTVRQCYEKEVVVNFDDYGVATIGLHTFCNYDRNLHKNVAFRKQLPLTLGFASTRYQLQGYLSVWSISSCN